MASLCIWWIFLHNFALTAPVSSPYGHWIGDSIPNISFVYTASQENLPSSAVPPNAPFGKAAFKDQTSRGDREHTFMLGNDRFVLLGSNYGTWRLRQDEGSPKFLTDSDVDHRFGWLFGGGVAYLFDTNSGEQLLTSAYDANASHPHPRVFGIGSGTSTVAKAGLALRHTVAVLPGDDPVVLVEAEISNTRDSIANVTLSEAWGTGMVHQLTGHGWGGWSSGDATHPDTMDSLFDRRQFVARHYRSAFSQSTLPVERGGGGAIAVQTREFLGLTDAENAYAAKTANIPWPPPAGASLWDTHPPLTFLAALTQENTDTNTNTDTDTNTGSGPSPFCNSAREFWGTGGLAAPGRGTQGVCGWHASVPEGESALIATTTLVLRPGDSAKRRFVFGYLPRSVGGRVADLVPRSVGGRVADLVRAAARRFDPARPLQEVAGGEWGPLLVQAKVERAPWVGRELGWHSFKLMAAVSYDEHFGEHIIDQGTAYRYAAGFQGAIRDPLQHALPLTLTRPDLVRQVIRYSLKEMRHTVTAWPGSADNPVLLPDSVIGSGVVRPGTPRPDDFELYLLHCATEYVFSSKDVAFLHSAIGNTTSALGPTSALGNTTTLGNTTVLDALIRAANFTMHQVGVGEHGLLRLLSSDWDDGFKPPPAAEPVSESVLTSALAAAVLPRWAALLRSIGGHDAAAAEAASMGASLRRAIINTAWNGKWLRRAWLGPNISWVGDDEGSNLSLYSGPVGWALLAGVFDQHETELDIQVSNLLSQCRNHEWRVGFGYRCNNTVDPRPGSGSWPAVNHPTLMGLARANRTQLAWEEFELNSLYHQSSVFPEQWLGTWTSSDTSDSTGLPGNWTWGFPAHCTHRHAWPLVSFPYLAGISWTMDGVQVRPALPLVLGTYSFSSPRASIARTDNDTWLGHYTADRPGRWVVSFNAISVAGEGASVRVALRSDTAGSESREDVGEAVDADEMWLFADAQAETAAGDLVVRLQAPRDALRIHFVMHVIR